VYGPRQDSRGAYVAVIMKVLEHIERGDAPVVHGDGSQAYDFVHVTDCARANVCAMRSDATDGFYNVGTGVRTSIRELAELLLEVTGSELEIRFEPADRVFVTNRVGCPELAARDLGYRAEVALRDGLADVVRWWRSERGTR
jgi:UDP-glucose 4-epimerase